MQQLPGVLVHARRHQLVGVCMSGLEEFLRSYVGMPFDREAIIDLRRELPRYYPDDYVYIRFSNTNQLVIHVGALADKDMCYMWEHIHSP